MNNGKFLAYIRNLKKNKCETKAFFAKHIFFCQKNRVGTNKGQSALIRDNWYFLKKIGVPY